MACVGGGYGVEIRQKRSVIISERPGTIRMIFVTLRDKVYNVFIEYL